jgi:hypothetical protein
MIRWVDRSFVLRPHQVAYHARSLLELVDERGNTMFLASLKAHRNLS